MAKKHIRFNWAAKKILRDKKNIGILEVFLSELLGEAGHHSVHAAEASPQNQHMAASQTSALAR
jgi:hypothetical protein